MMFQIPAQTITRELSLCFYTVLIFLELGIGLYFWNANRKNKELKMIGSIGFFFSFVAVGRILLIVFDYYMTVMNYALFETYFPFYKFATDVQAVGFAFFIFVAEQSVFQGKDKYSFLIGYVICQLLATIIPTFDLSQTLTIVAGLFVLFIPISYIYAAIKAKGPFRTQVLFIIFGVAFFAAGTLLLGEGVMQSLEPLLGSRYAVHILSVGLKLIGVLIVYRGFHLQLSR